MINLQNPKIRELKEKSLKAMVAGMSIEDKEIILKGAADEILDYNLLNNKNKKIDYLLYIKQAFHEIADGLVKILSYR